MITRIWHGKTARHDSDSYLEFLLNDGTKGYRQTPGNTSVKVWQKMEDEYAHFYTVTEWENLEAIKAFAGEDHEKAVYYPSDGNVLVEREEKAHHYESFDLSGLKIRRYILQLEQLYNGGSWQGESFSEKLADVDEFLAFRSPVPAVHSIAEIVWHCTYWKTVLIKHMRGDHQYRNETMQQLNFLPVEELKKKGWSYLKNELDTAHSVIMDMLREKNDSFLQQECRPGDDLEYFVEGIVQHDIYHLGQIGLVKKIISVTGG